ncbi:hypothetical protein E2542_SST15947 [Spatholobus suberectus]|nr:hypothetical protein E2542_SST15947 [Spatholobus suberectus]
MRHRRARRWSFSGVARLLGFRGSSHLLGCLSLVAIHVLFTLSLAINLVEGWVCDDAFVSGQLPFVASFCFHVFDLLVLGQRDVHEDQPCRGAIDAIAVLSTSA